MKPALDQLLANIMLLPRKQKAYPSMSFADLLDQSGYCVAYGSIHEADILAALRYNQAYVDDWVEYSENKRSNAGWYIERIANAAYVVGYYSEKGGRQSETRHADPAKACAIFIKREIEDVRRHMLVKGDDV